MNFEIEEIFVSLVLAHVLQTTVGLGFDDDWTLKLVFGLSANLGFPGRSKPNLSAGHAQG